MLFSERLQQLIAIIPSRHGLGDNFSFRTLQELLR